MRLIVCVFLALLAGAVSVGRALPAVRVVGGSTIEIQSAPWTVFIVDGAGSTQYVCTGSVIDASHILTAAHCLYDPAGTLTQASSVSVKAGVSNFWTPISTDAEQDRSVSSFRVHPGYVSSETVVPDDVAVLTLVGPLDLSGPAVKAVALQSSTAPFPAGAAVMIAGFGQQDPSADPSGELKSMTGTAEPQGECGQGKGAAFTEWNAIFLCATAPSSSTCHGDSGAGMVTVGATPVLVAVVGYGVQACTPGSQNIYAYVGAAEVSQFIQGNDNPPTAPRPLVVNSWRLTWKPPLAVGNTITCSAGRWPGPVRVVYTFLNETNGHVLQTGPRATYVLPRKVVGTAIVCDAAVTNSGGTTLVTTSTHSKVRPARRRKSKG
jgi:secreted trypsin-like serine protease